jgi:hypothetical protein
LGKKKISRITLAALGDLGYAVNYTAADPYGISDIGSCRGCNRRKLKGATSSIEYEKPKTTPCGSGIHHDRAVSHGRKMMREMHSHQQKQSGDYSTQSEGAFYVGHKRISVTYRQDDGTLCTVVVSDEDAFGK